MADAVFEYIDKNKRTHRVDDIYKVPEEYRGNVLVIGVEEQPAEETQTTQQTEAPGGFSVGGFDLMNYQPPPSHYGALIAAVLFIRTKNYALRCLLGGAIGIWGIYTAGQWFAGSDLMKTKVEQLAEDGKKSALLNRQAK